MLLPAAEVPLVPSELPVEDLVGVNDKDLELVKWITLVPVVFGLPTRNLVLAPNNLFVIRLPKPDVPVLLPFPSSSSSV